VAVRMGQREGSGVSADQVGGGAELGRGELAQGGVADPVLTSSEAGAARPGLEADDIGAGPFEDARTHEVGKCRREQGVILEDEGAIKIALHDLLPDQRMAEPAGEIAGRYPPGPAGTLLGL